MKKLVSRSAGVPEAELISFIERLEKVLNYHYFFVILKSSERRAEGILTLLPVLRSVIEDFNARCA